MTYKICKNLIEIAERNGAKTQKYISEMKAKLDIFLLNNRITEEEYAELTGILDEKE